LLFTTQPSKPLVEQAKSERCSLQGDSELLDQWMQKIAQDLEIEEIPQKQEGDVYLLAINPQMTIRVGKLDPGVSFWAPISPCPTTKREELFILLMKANFLGQGTGGSTIGLDENENFLTLSSILPYDMSYKTFKDALEDFTNHLDYWREELLLHKKTAENNLL
jgi:Tir chaperone protein (CesT) family